ncbi:MAG: hypothetical protein KME03_07125 [Aphanocapsa lilacina HA4352-LM1]|jgi:hypothetical protein|nr:hypothetical protein [Aphanocapsa lilacina HA4352-LM1]
MGHLGEERDGKRIMQGGGHDRVELQGEDYTVTAKDGRGVLCCVEHGRVVTFELSDEDVDRFGTTLGKVEKRRAERQKKSDRDRGMEH